MSTDITVYEPLAVMPILDIQGAMIRRQAMVDFVKTILVEGVDFGTIPGTDKPTLLKPGAEKLTTFFGLSKRFEIMEKVEDWTGAKHGEPFFYYLYRARLYRSEVLIAEADGSASSWESKYRYRWVGEFDVPSHLDKATLTKRGGKQTEFTFAVDKAETGGKYGKPAAYWKQYQDAINNGTARPVKKNTSAGKTMDAWEIDSTVYRVPNPDPADVVNTIQKMSQKRALIAATLLAVNASEFFTQDMEDFIDVEYTTQPAPATAPRVVVVERQPERKLTDREALLRDVDAVERKHHGDTWMGDLDQPPPAKAAQPTATNGNIVMPSGRVFDVATTAKPWDQEQRPWSLDNVIGAIRYAADKAKNETPANDGTWGALLGRLDSAPFDTMARHALLRMVFGVESSKDLTGKQRYALVKWANPAKVDGVWAMDANAYAEYAHMAGLDIEEKAFAAADPDGWNDVDSHGHDAAKF